jgi:hypothetical protein
MTLRRFKDHPAYRPLTVVSDFKKHRCYVAMDDDTKQVYWSGETIEEVNGFAAVIADTLAVNVAVFTVEVFYA